MAVSSTPLACSKTTEKTLWREKCLYFTTRMPTACFRSSLVEKKMSRKYYLCDFLSAKRLKLWLQLQISACNSWFKFWRIIEIFFKGIKSLGHVFGAINFSSSWAPQPKLSLIIFQVSHSFTLSLIIMLYAFSLITSRAASNMT